MVGIFGEKTGETEGWLVAGVLLRVSVDDLGFLVRVTLGAILKTSDEKGWLPKSTPGGGYVGDL